MAPSNNKDTTMKFSNFNPINKKIFLLGAICYLVSIISLAIWIICFETKYKTGFLFCSIATGMFSCVFIGTALLRELNQK